MGLLHQSGRSYGAQRRSGLSPDSQFAAAPRMSGHAFVRRNDALRKIDFEQTVLFAKLNYAHGSDDKARKDARCDPLDRSNLYWCFSSSLCRREARPACTALEGLWRVTRDLWSRKQRPRLTSRMSCLRTVVFAQPSIRWANLRCLPCFGSFAC